MKMIDWFKHDINAQTDIKIKKLLKAKGYEGYGLYWHVVEMLYVNGGKINRCELEEELDLLDRKDFLETLLRLDLVGLTDDGSVTNGRVLGELAESEAKRKERSDRMRDVANIRWSYKSKEAEKPSAPETIIEDEPSIEYQKIVDQFNSVCISLPKVKSLTDKRRKAIKACYKTYGEQVYEAMGSVEASDFLTGRSGAWSGCSFDWLFIIGNMTKVLEGNYANKNAVGKIKGTEISMPVTADGSNPNKYRNSPSMEELYRRSRT